MDRKSSLKLTDIEILCRNNCKIKNVENVERKINELIKGGTEKLQIVSDFDFTITKQHLNSEEKKVPSSFGIFEKCKNLPQSFIEESHELYKKYRPIEIDPHMPRDEKIAYMIEWWSRSSTLLKGFEFQLNQIDEVVEKFENLLRDGCYELFYDLFKLNVPVLVFSAGLGDSVLSVLRHSNVLFPNVKVISNFLQFRDGNILNGFQEKMIHTFNKNEHALEGTDYYNQVHDRDHVIVMGDSLGDAQMADGVPAQSHLLKIGFLYHHVEQNLPVYMDTFDIVLIDDQTMDVPRKLLELITKTS